jgi:hypothetical protein
MIEMIATIELAHRDHLYRHADDQRGDKRQNGAEHEASGKVRERGGEIGTDHVERAVRQIDQIHDAEHERQTSRQQKQQQAELQAVQALLDKESHGDDDIQ